MHFDKTNLRFETDSSRDELALAGGILLSPGLLWLAVTLIHWLVD